MIQSLAAEIAKYKFKKTINIVPYINITWRLFKQSTASLKKKNLKS